MLTVLPCHYISCPEGPILVAVRVKVRVRVRAGLGPTLYKSEGPAALLEQVGLGLRAELGSGSGSDEG